MFELPTKPSSIELEIARVRAISLMMQDDNDTDRKLSKNESDDLGEFTLSSDIEEDHLDNLQEVLHLDQVHPDKIIQTTRVPTPKKRSRADTVTARTSLLNW
jgi:copper oxidase (laccase) domain-containing protein